MAGISSLGIGSGVLSSDLVDKLVAAERKPAEDRLTLETQKNEALLSAYGKLRSAVTELRLPMRQLSAADNLTAYSATSSNDSVEVSLDNSKAGRGSYTVEVLALAQAQSLASGTFADKDATTVGEGTITLKSGVASKKITIDGTYNSLQGLANEINESGIGVTAGVIDTGDGYRLVMSSEETGTANAISLTVNDDDGNNTDAAGLSQFAFNGTTSNLTETVAAKDSQVRINGIDISRSSNNIENVIDGLSFEVKEEGVTSVIKVERDLGAVADRVQSFVDKFNALQGTIDSLAGYDAEAGRGGILNGDSIVRGIQNDLRNLLTRVVPGLENASVRTLADVGISTNPDTGGLELDREKFEEKLEQNPDDVTALFAEQGRASDSQVEFVRSGTATVPGSYDINITRAATQGSLTGGATLGSNVSITSANDDITFEVNGGTSVSITLDAGAYATPQDLVDQIQAKLNENDALKAAGTSVAVDLDGTGALRFTSEAFGESSNVSITSIEDGSAYGLAEASGTAGQNVAGTIDGKLAEGDGQVLFLGAGRGDASGLQVRVAGTDTGSRGTITFIEGVAERTVNLVTGILGADGAIASRTEGLNQALEEVQQDRLDLEERLTSYRERLVAQFSAADALIAQLNNTRDFVTQQLAALAPQNRNND